jgi:RNA polymerase sigma-70 factor (ECF subfamily)
MVADSARFPVVTVAASPAVAPACEPAPPFLEVYDTHVDFVWRTARRLGVAPHAVDDVVQETFLVVHRHLGEPRSGSLRGWIYGIAVRVVRNHRRSLRRKSPHVMRGEWSDPDELADRGAPQPDHGAEKAEVARLLHALLAGLDDDKREVFVLVELEQLTVPEVAVALGVNVNTVSSRLRLARAEFEEAARRHRARDEWRLR